MKKRFLVLLLSSLILAGCRVGNGVSVVSKITPVFTASPTGTVTATLTPTQTGTPTISPDVMRYQCLNIAESLPPDRSLKGVIAYNGDYNLSAYLSNQETNDTDLFPREEGDRLLDFEVSPNGKYLLYTHYSVSKHEDRLVIVTPDGQPVWSKVVDDSAVSWFDSERLVSTDFLDNGTHRLLLFNPFSGKQESLRADFPDSEVFSPDFLSPWYYTSRGLPVYDPKGTRAVYPAIEDQHKWATIIVWDTKTNKKVIEIPTQDFWGATPIWTPDGTQFIIAMDINASGPPPSAQEIFSVSRAGQTRQITHFTGSFAKYEVLGGYSLSPDGKLLAFWIVAQPSPYDGPRLAVLNIDTGVVTNYCIKGDSFADEEGEPAPPVWSPDSSQTLVISRAPEDKEVRRVVVVDIVRNYAAQINKDMQPEGWMAAP